MKDLQDIIQSLGLSIAKEATTRVSFWRTETYSDFLSEDFPDLVALDISKPNFPISSLNHLVAEEDKAQERICSVFEAYNRKSFLSKLWWRIANWDESIEDYGHFYTIIRSNQLKKTYTAIVDTLINYPDTPKYFLVPQALDALILYFSSFLPSHNMFNRFFQEHHQVCHSKIEAQFNQLAQDMELGFHSFRNALQNIFENINDLYENQQIIQKISKWVLKIQKRFDAIPEADKGNYENLESKFSEINLELGHLIQQIGEKKQVDDEKQLIIGLTPKKVVNPVPQYFLPDVIHLKKPALSQSMPEDTLEACTAWLEKCIDNPETLEKSLNAMRKHTEQLTKNADKDLLRYTLLSQLSVHWVEAIKWQHTNDKLKNIKFSCTVNEAAQDAKTNLDTLWKKVFARHYHTDKNVGMDEETMEKLTKTTQAFNEEKSRSCQLIDEAIKSNVCPDWIKAHSSEYDFERRTNASRKFQQYFDDSMNEMRKDLGKLRQDLDDLNKLRDKNREEIDLINNRNREEIDLINNRNREEIDLINNRNREEINLIYDRRGEQILSFQREVEAFNDTIKKNAAANEEKIFKILSSLYPSSGTLRLSGQNASNASPTSLLPKQLKDEMTPLIVSSPVRSNYNADNREKKVAKLIGSKSSISLNDDTENSDDYSKQEIDVETSSMLPK